MGQGGSRRDPGSPEPRQRGTRRWAELPPALPVPAGAESRCPAPALQHAPAGSSWRVRAALAGVGPGHDMLASHGSGQVGQGPAKLFRAPRAQHSKQKSASLCDKSSVPGRLSAPQGKVQGYGPGDRPLCPCGAALVCSGCSTEALKAGWLKIHHLSSHTWADGKSKVKVLPAGCPRPSLDLPRASFPLCPQLASPLCNSSLGQGGGGSSQGWQSWAWAPLHLI